MNTLVRYMPRAGASMTTLAQDFDRALGSFWNDSSCLVRTPAVDIKEEDGRYVLEAELAGLSEDDVEVKVHENLLTISAKTEEKKETENEEENGNYVLRERRSSSFARSFVLPKDVDREHINAAFKNGVLTLGLPKVPEAKPRTIKVETTK